MTKRKINKIEIDNSLLKSTASIKFMTKSTLSWSWLKMGSPSLSLNKNKYQFKDQKLLIIYISKELRMNLPIDLSSKRKYKKAWSLQWLKKIDLSPNIEKITTWPLLKTKHSKIIKKECLWTITTIYHHQIYKIWGKVLQKWVNS